MYSLRDYQKVAVQQSLVCIETAKHDFAVNMQRTAIVLSAPTGAGKTIMSGDVIDKLLSPGESSPSKHIILWLTDNPSLNRQSANRMKDSTSGNFTTTVLSGSGGNFDSMTFTPGNLYLLNTQAASEGAGMSNVADIDCEDGAGRTYSIWDTIRNTVRQHGVNFIVMIDEAHRGVEKSEGESTIIGRIIKDVPIVYGISATEKKFVDWMERESRHVKRIDVSITDVRNAGIIKNNLIVSDTINGKNAHVTLLKDAVRQTLTFEKSWHDYCSERGIPKIYPLLVVQVEDSGSDPDKQTLFAYDLDLMLKGILDEWSTLTDENIVHTFSEHKALEIEGVAGGKRVIQYMAPDLINNNDKVRVVIAKMAIATGWDCPRAEVLVSFRRASDETYITQLIGRMIRQPLGMRIDSDESLNSTYCTLPNFDQDAVRRITKRLRDEEGMALDVVNMWPLTYERNALLPQRVFDALLTVPTYNVPSGSSASQVALLRRFAAALARDGINEGATDHVKSHLCDFLDTIPDTRERVFRKAMEQVMAEEAAYRRSGKDKVVEINRTHIAIEEDSDAVEVGTTLVKKDTVDLERAFMTDSVLPEDVRAIYQVHLTNNGFTPVEANRRMKAYNYGRLDTVNILNESAQTFMKAWELEYGEFLENLMFEPDDKYSVYREVTGKHNDPLLEPLALVPQVIQENISRDLIKAGTKVTGTDNATVVRRWVLDQDRSWYKKHLFSSPEINDSYLADINSLKLRVLRSELDEHSCIAWYNNPDRGPRSLRLPWVNESEEWAEITPDFILFHETSAGEVKPSLVDVLNHPNKVLLKKLHWWCRYAEVHLSELRSIKVVIQSKSGSVLFVDLADRDVLGHLTKELTRDSPEMEMFFREYGGEYSKIR